MATKPPDGEINPYAAPEARIGETPAALAGDLAEAESIRRTYINHEASIRSIGALHLFGAVVLFIALIGLVVGVSGSNAGAGGPAGSGAMIGFAIFAAVMMGFSIALGVGLRKLQPWARWVDSGLIGLGLVSSVIQTAIVGAAGGNVGFVVGRSLVSWLIYGYILSLLLSSKNKMVFSPEYKEIIAKTPHVKYKTSCIVKGFLIVLVAIIGLAVIGAILGTVTQR